METSTFKWIGPQQTVSQGVKIYGCMYDLIIFLHNVHHLSFNFIFIQIVGGSLVEGLFQPTPSSFFFFPYFVGLIG